MNWWRRRDVTPITKVQVLDLRPGDRLLVEFPGRGLTREMAEEIRSQAAAAFGTDEKRVIVVSNATVKVLREGEPPPPPVIIAPGKTR